MRIARCQSPECRAEIAWAMTENGKRMPLDATPEPNHGTVVLCGERQIARVFATPQEARAYIFMHEGEGPYISHFASCPAARRHRRRAA